MGRFHESVAGPAVNEFATRHWKLHGKRGDFIIVDAATRIPLITVPGGERIAEAIVGAHNTMVEPMKPRTRDTNEREHKVPGFVHHEDGHPDNWICICGNTERGAGFAPCDANGSAMEPVDAWPELYRCGSCNSIIKHPTREIVRQGAPRFRIQFTETTVYETWVNAPTAIEAATKAHRQFNDEGPENLTFVSNSTCDWLAFDEKGEVTDINDDDLEAEESEGEATV